MKIITLSREFGAGGHSIGRAVAKELGIEFYDRDIIRAASKAGLDAEVLAREGEEITRADSFWSHLGPLHFDQKDAMFEAQKQAVLEVAAKGPCVILGRCADVILEEAGIETLNVFLYSGAEHRAARVGEIIGSSDAGDIIRAMKKTDRNRRSYYETYTGRPWGICKNYTLSLDSGILGYDTCIRIICEAAK